MSDPEFKKDLRDVALMLLGLILIGLALCGCATQEESLARWFEYKNQQLQQEPLR